MPWLTRNLLTCLRISRNFRNNNFARLPAWKRLFDVGEKRCFHVLFEGKQMGRTGAIGAAEAWDGGDPWGLCKDLCNIAFLSYRGWKNPNGLQMKYRHKPIDVPMWSLNLFEITGDPFGESSHRRSYIGIDSTWKGY